MHKYCGDEQLACHYPHCMCNCNCCGAALMLPRNCSSCTWPRQNDNNEWKCCTRCSNEKYKKLFKPQFDTPLSPRTQHAPKQPISMLNLHTAKPLEEVKTAPPVKSTTKQKSNKKQPKIKRSAEIVIERPSECKAGYLRTLAKTPNCDCKRMRALLLQQALFNECNCDPYDLLPNVPLTFYPKWPCKDNIDMCKKDESMTNLLRYINSDGQCCPNVRKMLSKKFLGSLNKLYANVGGGKNGAFDFEHYFYGPADREYEFEGFFGKLTRSTFKLPLGSVISNERNSHLVQPRGWKSLTDKIAQLNFNHRSISFKSQKRNIEARPSIQSFQYPTKIPPSERQHFKTSPSQILKYLGRGRSSKKFKPIERSRVAS